MSTPEEFSRQQVVVVDHVPLWIGFDVLNARGEIIWPRNSRGETPLQRAERILREERSRTRKQGTKRR